MRLGTKLTLYLSLIIVVVLSGYGYLDILSRRDILVRKMKAEVRGTGRTLEASLDKIFLQEDKNYVQDLINVVTEYERILGVIVFSQKENLILRSKTLGDKTDPYLGLIMKSMEEDRPTEEFGAYRKVPIFAYAFPLKDGSGQKVGGVSILQDTSYMEREIGNARWSIIATVFVLMGGILALLLFGTREWVTKPISNLVGGIENLKKGNLDYRIELKGKNELSNLAQAFNQMAGDLKRAQRQIIQDAETRLGLERNLRQSEKLATIGQLASGLAHEIGTPLNIIAGRAELIKRRHQDDDDQKNPDIILQQTERITRIIQQLLGFVRKKRPERKPIGISTLVESVLDLLGPEIHRYGVAVVKKWKNDGASVLGDPDQLQQVFLNLVLNAIQSMPGGGMLHLSISSKMISKGGLEEDRRQYAEICVEDTGTGIESEMMGNLFNPFFTTKEEGTGLGLMVTQGIIQEHEGWIDVQSEVGRGSAFRVYLPVCEAKRNGPES